MAKKQKSIKANAVAAPAMKEEAEQLLHEIGTLQRMVSSIENAMNDELAKVKAEHEEKAKPINEEIEGKFHALHAWAETNKGTLLKGKSKTATLATGVVLWRTTPPSVSIKNADEVMAELKKLRLKQFIRVTESVNKEAILAAPAKVDGIAGIKITQREEFVAKPFESEIERSEPVKAKPAKKVAA
jgi:phage host-nuclease inhibitor protein Gam